MARPCVLVVDDEPDLLDTLRVSLESSLQVKVVGALSAKEGLQALEVGGIDLIIADYRMPMMDGLEFLRRAFKLHPQVPRILLTAYPDMQMAIDLVNQAGISQFLTKPINADQLRSVVEAQLRDSRSQSQHAAAFTRAAPSSPDTARKDEKR